MSAERAEKIAEKIPAASSGGDKSFNSWWGLSGCRGGARSQSVVAHGSVLTCESLGYRVSTGPGSRGPRGLGPVAIY